MSLTRTGTFSPPLTHPLSPPLSPFTLSPPGVPDTHWDLLSDLWGTDDTTTITTGTNSIDLRKLSFLSAAQLVVSRRSPPPSHITPSHIHPHIHPLTLSYPPSYTLISTLSYLPHTPSYIYATPPLIPTLTPPLISTLISTLSYPSSHTLLFLPSHTLISTLTLPHIYPHTPSNIYPLTHPLIPTLISTLIPTLSYLPSHPLSYPPSHTYPIISYYCLILTTTHTYDRAPTYNPYIVRDLLISFLLRKSVERTIRNQVSQHHHQVTPLHARKKPDHHRLMMQQQQTAQKQQEGSDEADVAYSLTLSLLVGRNGWISRFTHQFHLTQHMHISTCTSTHDTTLHY